MGILMDDFAHGRNVTALPEGVRAFTWDTKIQDLFPDKADWALAGEWAGEKANVRDVLAHVSGLPACVYITSCSQFQWGCQRSSGTMPLQAWPFLQERGRPLRTRHWTLSRD